jgi:uncharacterized protein (DUF488 family)
MLFRSSDSLTGNDFIGMASNSNKISIFALDKGAMLKYNEIVKKRSCRSETWANIKYYQKVQALVLSRRPKVLYPKIEK